MIQTDSNRLPVNRKLLARFFEKIRVDPNVMFNGTPCWLMKGDPARCGYARFWLNGRHVPAHRFTYERFVGIIPDNLEPDHLCKVRNCASPLHLEIVSHRDNSLRGDSPPANHARKTRCVNGHKFSTENTYLHPVASHRSCRACRNAVHRERNKREDVRRYHREYSRKYRHKLKGAAEAPT